MGNLKIAFYVLGLIGSVIAWPNPSSKNSTYYNPILPGFHPDPSCIFVKEWDNTFFCASSTFLAFPGIPIHASKDLVNWKLISYAFNRPEQLPIFGNYTGQQDGWYAPTIRFRKGVFYVIDSSVGGDLGTTSGILTSTNPYDDAAWSAPLIDVALPGYDPDLFWDIDSTLHVAAAAVINQSPFTTNIQQVVVDLPSGNATAPTFMWNGTGAASPEGPHLYLKDGWYYLLIAEGGTELGHRVNTARSKNVTGPFESYSGNPILTNANTTQYFQTVGHADLFQDAVGNWWGVALATRSGPEYANWPMGRETCLYPVTWEKGQWPTLQPVRGKMSGPLPPIDKSIAGTGAFARDPDYYDFEPGSSIPTHFTYWRFPIKDSYAISPPGHPYTLQLRPSYANLSAYAGFEPATGQTLIMRRQTDSLFTYSVDVNFTPENVGEESGVTLFLNQDAHADLGIVSLNSSASPYLRFRAEGPDAPASVLTAIPKTWLGEDITLRIQAYNITHFSFSAAAKYAASGFRTIAHVPATLVSSGFTGM